MLAEAIVKVLKHILHLSYFSGSYIILATEFPRCSFLLYLPSWNSYLGSVFPPFST